MEKEGYIRAIKFMENQGLEIGLFVSVRHKQISKWMHEECLRPVTSMMYGTQREVSGMYHVLYTIYTHIGFQKKVDKLGKQKECESAYEWKRSMINHLYWSVTSTEDGNSLLVKEKWLSLINHIHNKHRVMVIFSKNVNMAM